MKRDIEGSYVSDAPFLTQIGSGDIGRRRGVGRGKPKTLKTLRVEGSGRILVGKISTCPRYMIDITGTDPLSLG